MTENDQPSLRRTTTSEDQSETVHRVQLLLAIFVMVRIITATTSIGTTNDPGTTTSSVMSPRVMLNVLRLSYVCIFIFSSFAQRPLCVLNASTCLYLG